MSVRVRWGSGALAALILGIPSAPHAGPPARAAYVVGSSDATLARVDLDTQVVVPNVATLGSIANRIEVAPDLAWAAVANSGSDDVTILDLLTESVVGTIALPSGANPWTVEIAGDRLFATALGEDALYELDPDLLTVVDAAATGRAPEGVCTAGGRIWIANTGFDLDTFSWDPGTVTVLDLADLSPVATVPVGLNPQECLVGPDGRVHVVCTGDFFLTAGSIHVLDPATAVPLDTLDVPGYPGGGAATPGGEVVLNVLTFAFGSEIWTYDAASLAWGHDGSDPLFATSDFLGNPRVTAAGQLILPDFDADLLVLEDLAAPGSPTALLVNDGPIDAGVVEREDPVPILLSGLSAIDADDGIRLEWRATIEADVHGFVVARRTPAVGDFVVVASGLPARRETAWVDRDVELDVPYTYRVGALDGSGSASWSSPITVVRRAPSAGRLAIRGVFPNPSRSGTSLALHLPRAAPVVVEILDVRGRRVASLDAGELPRGDSTVTWSGRDARGALVAPGVYFARVHAGDGAALTRIVRTR